MSTSLVLILVHLLGTFVMGLLLGWLLWKFGGSAQSKSAETEMNYWKERLDQSRAECNLAKDRVSALQQEKETLKKRLSAKLADHSA